MQQRSLRRKGRKRACSLRAVESFSLTRAHAAALRFSTEVFSSWSALSVAIADSFCEETHGKDVGGGNASVSERPLEQAAACGGMRRKGQGGVLVRGGNRALSVPCCCRRWRRSAIVAVERFNFSTWLVSAHFACGATQRSTYQASQT